MRACAASCVLVFALTAPVSAQDTVQVKAGWNNIGSVKAGAVPEVLSTVPDGMILSTFFGYKPGTGYESTDTLGKGLGYWVKVSSDGMIIFQGSTFAGCGVKRVEHGGYSYGTVQIGIQCWLSENLNVGVDVPEITGQTDNATTEKFCYDDYPINCGVYGGLYQWDEAMQYATTPGARGICPEGWHIPTLGEYQTLSSTVGGNGNALKQGGVGWGAGEGTNTSGFSALLAGVFLNDFGGSINLGFSEQVWSSTESDATSAALIFLNYLDGSIRISNEHKDNGVSVRCLED